MTELEGRLGRWRREVLAATLLDGAVRVLLWAGPWLLLSAAADAAFTLPLAWRWVLFLGGASAGTAAVALAWVIPLARLTPACVLRAASARYPELAPYILPAWELAQDEVRHTSRDLARAHIERTQSLLAALPALPLAAARPDPGARRRAWLAAAVFVAAPVFYLRSPDLGRVLFPWRETALERLVQVSPGDARIAWGASATVEARWLGGLVDRDLELWTRTPSSPWARIAWDRRSGWGHAYELVELTAPVQYQVRWRDQGTRVFSLTPVPYPQMAQLKARVGPAGAPRAELALEGGGEVAALRGSWVAVLGRPSVPLARASLRVSYLPAPVEMRPAAGGWWEGGFPLAQDGTFSLELASGEGISDPRPPSYGLKALEDQPPAIELLSPAFDVEAAPRDPLPVTYLAQDDFGLSRVELLVHLPDKTIVLPVARFEKPVREHIGDHPWDLSGLPLGQRVEFQLRATDDNAAQPRQALSRPGAVRVIDFDAAHREMEKRWLEAGADFKALAEREALARRLLERLSRPPGDPKTRGEWEALERQLEAAWSEAVRGLQELSESMDRDPYANPGLAEEMRSLAQETAAASQELPRASQEAKAGEWGPAQRRHASLESQARRAERALSSGRELQALQDFWSQASRMDQDGRDLASSLEQAAQQGRPPSGADLKRLQEALGDVARQMEELAKVVESLPKPQEGKTDPRRVFVVPLDEARREADALQRALERGDWKEAARLARRLAEQLGRVREAIADAARQAASGSGAGGGEDPLSSKLEALAAQWQQALEEQSRSLGLAQNLEAERTKALLDAQRRLLERLEARQRAALRDAEGLGGFVAADVKGMMQAVLAEFTAREVSRAPEFLEQAQRRLRQLAGGAPARRAGLEALAREEAGILEELKGGVPRPPPTEGQVAAASAASGIQAQARRRTAALGQAVRDLTESGAPIPASVPGSAEAAEREQSGALEALKRPDMPAVLRHEESALEHLEHGAKAMSEAAQRQKRVESGSVRPFSGPGPRGVVRPMPGGRGGRTGADTGFVPLPSADDYRPPEEIRRDLEKSLQERRPRSYDEPVKEYFKRISQ